MSLTNFDSFPSLADFRAALTADALKWTDLEQNVVYQITNTRTAITQHGQSVILSLQKADGSSMGVRHAIDRAATKPHDNGKLATVCTGEKTSKNGRVYNLYQLL